MEVDEFLTAHRLLRWEDGLARLLDARMVAAETVKEVFPRNHGIAAFFVEHQTKRSGHTT
ncbi:hypothetical protein [Ralstonia soli]|uniref:Uncharacterized protein n=1 Tax=Ralstonia soli TaxID=2953896 RepID=A0ABT1AEG6_9RALS|nr:hypothetical protein [Ralstonia soli]MCO5396780.1 hypothetical protein [Ralstonia soli]